jgi:hypothetical protein
MPPHSRSGCGSHARSSITQAHEPHLDHGRRKDVLPRLNNDGPLCVLGLLCCLKLCRFCSMVIGADISAWWRVRKTTCHHPQSLRRAGRCWGLCRYRELCHLKVPVWIPARADGAQLPVARAPARLSPHRRPCFGPRPRWGLAEAFAHHGVPRRRHHPVGERLAVVRALPVMRHPGPGVPARGAPL